MAVLVGALLLLALALAATFAVGSRLLASADTIIVAADGSGHVTTLGEAVAMAETATSSSSGRGRTPRS